MNVQFVATVFGKERSGIMQSLSKQTDLLGGKWLDSRLSHLEGQFIGLITIDIPAENQQALKDFFNSQEGVTAHFNEVEHIGSDREIISLSFDANDRPGLVRDISNVLADRHIDVDHIESHRVGLAELGKSMFTASIVLRVRPGSDMAMLESQLQKIDPQAVINFS